MSQTLIQIRGTARIVQQLERSRKRVGGFFRNEKKNGNCAASPSLFTVEAASRHGGQIRSDSDAAHHVSRLKWRSLPA